MGRRMVPESKLRDAEAMLSIVETEAGRQVSAAHRERDRAQLELWAAKTELANLRFALSIVDKEQVVQGLVERSVELDAKLASTTEKLVREMELSNALRREKLNVAERLGRLVIGGERIVAVIVGGALGVYTARSELPVGRWEATGALTEVLDGIAEREREA